MNIESMIEIRKMNIEDAPLVLNVNAVVNCANPTLMGSNSHVDYAIHQAIDNANSNNTGFFDKKIKKEFKRVLHTKREDIIRCGRGKAVITSGYGWCEYVIHAVGARSDCNQGRIHGVYSSSCVEKLTSCYENIMQLIFSHPGIKSVAIPIISAGNYGFGFEYAFTIGLTTVYNSLLEKKKELRELFDSLELKKIYFIVNEDSNYTEALEIKTRYKNTFLKEHRAVSRGAIKSQKEYSKEIELYDEQKGYFAIVSLVRKLLLKMRWVLGGWTFIKDFVSKEDWVCRRQIVEITALVKMVIPMIVLALSAYFRTNSIINIGLLLVVGYDLLDTVTYLLSLMFFADIQRPSANVSRSLIMLVINYVEVKLDMACIFMLIRNIQHDYKTVKNAIDFLIGGNGATWSQLLNWGNNGIKFFFLTIVLSYFSSHMRMRKFRTK